MTLLHRIESWLDRMLLDSYELGVDDRGNTVMHVRVWGCFPDSQITFQIADPPEPDGDLPPADPPRLAGPAPLR